MKAVIILSGGGSSSEREVSLGSGRAVFGALRPLIDVALFEVGEDALPEGMDPERFIIFPMIHGEFGEDGRLQALLDGKGFSYCGSGAAASRLCMDKSAAKIIVRDLGILTAESCFYNGQNFGELWAFFGGPFVVKPNDRGSSVGVSKIYGRGDFERYCSGWGRGKWLVEFCIEGRELTVGILDGRALPVVEICARGGFYGYRHKYTPGMAEYFVPAPLEEGQTRWLRGISERIFRACGCRDFARLDFILDHFGRFYFLEINAIPGMTATSLVPKAAAAAGISFPELCLRMLEPAAERDRRRGQAAEILGDRERDVVRF
ncbi:MAG: D-alanine--D-alanine ligase [Puniceicoccales bacterium]|jgi:D-alanine-D-alanine ligase|nr:D-alanine--D-alanine ligase [Puniceicoccales bacterium]